MQELYLIYDEVYLNRAIKMQSLGVIETEPDDGIFTSIKFVQNNPNISVMIVGTKNPSHLVNNIRQINSLENINDSVINELHERFDRLDEIDLDKVRHHYEDDGGVSVTEVKESIHADGDD